MIMWWGDVKTLNIWKEEKVEEVATENVEAQVTEAPSAESEEKPGAQAGTQVFYDQPT